MSHFLSTTNIHVKSPIPPAVEIGNEAASQCGTHVNSIKHKILSFIQPSDKETLGLEVPAHLSKDKRKLNNKITARFLIPHQHLDAFEGDPLRFVRQRLCVV